MPYGLMRVSIITSKILDVATTSKRKIQYLVMTGQRLFYGKENLGDDIKSVA
jgi:hypothetical protein